MNKQAQVIQKKMTNPKEITVYDEYLLICDRDLCAAAILGKLEAIITEKNGLSEEKLDLPKEPINYWVKMTLEDWQEALLGTFSKNTICKRLKTLRDMNYLEAKPINEFSNRTYAYRLNIEVLTERLKALAA